MRHQYGPLRRIGRQDIPLTEAGEIKNKDFASGRPITIRCSSTEKDPVLLEGHVYVVEY